MARIQVDPEALKRHNAPEGAHPAVLSTCELRPQKADPSKRKVYWEFLFVENDDTSLNGHKCFAHTSIELGAGDLYLSFVRDLGFDPADFDPEEAVGIECYVRISHSVSKDLTGKQSVQENVASVSKR